MNRNLWITLIAIAVIITSVGVIFWPFGNGKVLRLTGVVEVQEVRLGSKIGGRVFQVNAKEGYEVDSSQPLVIFEAPELENHKNQLQAKLAMAKGELARVSSGSHFEIDSAKAAADAAQARYEKVEKGWREEEIKHAQSELDTAQADYDYALKEFLRISGLYRDKSIARSEFEAALAYRDRAKGRKDAFIAKLSMSTSRKEDKAESRAEWQRAVAHFEFLRVTKPVEIKIAEAKIADLEEQVKAVQINLDEAMVKAPPNLGRAVVEVVAVRPGDLVQANQSVVRVLRVEDLWVKVFVPATQIGLVKEKMKVDVTLDSHPGKKFTGEVRQRENIAEFTPRNVQSVDERRHQVFGVKVVVLDANGVLNAGMAAEVTIPLE